MNIKEDKPRPVLKSRRKPSAATGACRSVIGIFKTLRASYGPQHWWLATRPAGPWPADTAFEVIVGAILTQNTSWKNVEKAVQNLKKENLLSFNKMLSVSIARLKCAIRPAGFFQIKAKYLKNFLRFLNQESGGNVNELFQQPLFALRKKLLSVGGIGPETADSILLYAARKPIFVVDAYTRRIFGRIGSVLPGASYAEIQKFFMNSLPKSERLFNEFHALIVEHAKRYCLKKPLCLKCPLRRTCHFFFEQGPADLCRAASRSGSRLAPLGLARTRMAFLAVSSLT